MTLAPTPRDGVSHDVLVERSAVLEMLAEMADRTATKSLAPRSKTAYAADWVAFTGWCETYGLTPLPAEPETVRLWLTDLSLQVAEDGGFRYSPASMERFLSSVARTHRDAGFLSPSKDPRVTLVMAGIRRERGARQRRARPLLTADLLRLTGAMDHERWPYAVSAARDTFALWLSYATAFRRSEVAGLATGGVRLQSDGLHVRLEHSKTDQESRGAVVGVPYGTSPATCVPCAYVRWLRLAAAASRAARMRVVLTRQQGHVCRSGTPPVDASDPLFRRVDKAGRVLERGVSGTALNEMLKRRLVQAGYDPRPYSYHSLRAGFVTQARRNGADARSVRLQTRHGSDAMVDVYDREHLPLTEENAVWRLGL